MNSPLVEVLEKYGVVGDVAISRFFRKGKRREISALHEELQAAVVRADADVVQNLLPTPFTFFASSSLRGDLHCWRSACRLSKLQSVERFASLYGDHVLLPISLSFRKDETYSSRLQASITVLDHLRPSIDSGLFVPVADSACMCESCAAKRSGAGDQFKVIAKSFIDHYISEVEAVFVGRNSLYGWPTFRLSGPNSLLRDDVLLHSMKVVPQDFHPDKLKVGQNLTTEEIRESEIVDVIYQKAIFDCASQRYYAQAYGCSYLSNNHKEAEILEAFTSRPAERSSFTLDIFAELVHEIPMFSQLTTAALRQLRADEPDAFSSYRAALQKAMQEYENGQLTSREIARDLFRDLILPQITALNAEEKNASRLRLQNMAYGLVVPALSVAFGMLGNLSHEVSNFLNLAGGAAGVQAVVEPFRERNRRQADIKNKPLYFMLEMEKRWKRSRSCSH